MVRQNSLLIIKGTPMLEKGRGLPFREQGASRKRSLF